MKVIILILSTVLLFSGCQKDEGPEVSRKVPLDDYNTVIFLYIFDVSLVPDTLNYAIVTCGENLIGFVSLECKDNGLVINQKSETNWNRSYKHTAIELHFTSLSYIQMKNCIKLESSDTIKASSFTIDDYSELSEVNINLNCNDFIMKVHGENAGIYKVAGRTINSSLWLDGSAHFITEYLVADSVYVNHKGIGDCFVNATRVLAGKIVLDGMLKYKKQPGLKVEVENEIGVLEGF